MSRKYDKLVLVIILFVIAVIFANFAADFEQMIMNLENELEYYYIGSNPLAKHHLDVYLFYRLKELYESQLNILVNTYMTFSALGWGFFISGLIYGTVSAFQAY